MTDVFLLLPTRFLIEDRTLQDMTPWALTLLFNYVSEDVLWFMVPPFGAK